MSSHGWKAETARIIEKDKKGKEKDKGWTCDLIPKALIVARYFAKEQTAIQQIATEVETVTAKLLELEEEHGGEQTLLLLQSLLIARVVPDLERNRDREQRGAINRRQRPGLRMASFRGRFLPGSPDRPGKLQRPALPAAHPA